MANDDPWDWGCPLPGGYGWRLEHLTDSWFFRHPAGDIVVPYPMLMDRDKALDVEWTRMALWVSVHFPHIKTMPIMLRRGPGAHDITCKVTSHSGHQVEFTEPFDGFPSAKLRAALLLVL